MVILLVAIKNTEPCSELIKLYIYIFIGVGENTTNSGENTTNSGESTTDSGESTTLALNK